MELTQISELDLGSCLESEHMNIGSQRILVSDQINAYQYSSEKVDNFVIDMDSFSSGINKDIINANSRTTLQRNLSRKGCQRWGDRNGSENVTLQDKDIVPTTSSPKASLLGPSKSTVGPTQNSTNTQQQVHHQITITTASSNNMCNNTPTENKCMTRRSSFGRSSSWLLDPKKVLLVFATLSSIGSLLLIFLTLSISKHNGVEYENDLQQLQ